MNLVDRIKDEMIFYEKARLNPSGTQAASCKSMYGRGWKKIVKEKIVELEKELDELAVK